MTPSMRRKIALALVSTSLLLACNGQAGIEEMLSILRAEFDVAMALCGCPNIASITGELLSS